MDSVGATGYGFTAFGALQSEDGPWADDVVTYSHTANRLRSGLSLAQASGPAWSQSYAYDAANRLSTLTSPAGAFGYTYAPVGADDSPAQLVRKLTLPGGSAITNQFDEQARELGTTLRNSGGTLLNQHLYDYNALDQRTKQTRVGTSSTSSVDISRVHADGARAIPARSGWRQRLAAFDCGLPSAAIHPPNDDGDPHGTFHQLWPAGAAATGDRSRAVGMDSVEPRFNRPAGW